MNHLDTYLTANCSSFVSIFCDKLDASEIEFCSHKTTGTVLLNLLIFLALIFKKQRFRQKLFNSKINYYKIFFLI